VQLTLDLAPADPEPPQPPVGGNNDPREAAGMEPSSLSLAPSEPNNHNSTQTETDYANVLPINSDEYLLNQLVWRAKLKRLARNGMKASAAARELGISPATAQQIYNDLEFRREVMSNIHEAFEDLDEKFEEQSRTMGEKLEEGANFALDKVITLLKSDESNLTDFQRSRVAFDILDRHQDSAKVNRNMQISPKLQSEDLRRAAQGAREMDTKIRRIS
jgi:hypothetical protein